MVRLVRGVVVNYVSTPRECFWPKPVDSLGRCRRARRLGRGGTGGDVLQSRLLRLARLAAPAARPNTSDDVVVTKNTNPLALDPCDHAAGGGSIYCSTTAVGGVSRLSVRRALLHSRFVRLVQVVCICAQSVRDPECRHLCPFHDALLVLRLHSDN